MKHIMLIRLLCLAAFCSVQSQADCVAQWIVPSEIRTTQSAGGIEQPAPNQWFCFRKQFEISEIPESLTARIACDSKYWLWINGNVVVMEGQLKRGPTPADTYVDIVELQDHLHVGTNTIAILLWYFGKDGFSHNSSGMPGLLFEAKDLPLVSDTSWRSRSHPAFGTSEKPHPNYRLPESNVLFDSRKDFKSWQDNNFDDSRWPPVKLASESQSRAWGELVTRPIPQWRNSQLLAYLKQSETKKQSGDRVIVASLPYNAQVIPYFRIRSPAGQTISVCTDNYRGGSEYNVRTDYVTLEGEQEFESPIWMNGHEVHYSIPAEVEVLELNYRETGYATDFAGSFECNDEFLNRLWNKSQRTLYVNMRDTYFDCPGRERAQWWGDVTLLLTEAFYALDRRSDLLSRKGILELAAWQRDDGTLFSPVPSGNWHNELPMQMLASVGRYGFWNYYQHSGDIDTLDAVYPAVKRYVLEVWQLGDDGLVIPRKGGWTWGDWGENKDLPLLYNGWYYLALDGLLNMAELLDDEQTQRLTRRRMQSIRSNFDKYFWDEHEYRSPKYSGLTDDRGQALAVVAGLAKPQRYKDIRQVFLNSLHASPYMEKYVLEALFQMRHPDDAIHRMKLRYQPMVDSPLTTLWEGWGIGEAGYGGGSYNHGWSGGPLILLSQKVTGIQPVLPGFKQFQVMPQLGTLHKVEASIATISGNISVQIEKSEKTYKLVAEVPDETTAHVGIPNEWAGTLTANGVDWEKYRPTKFPTTELMECKSMFRIIELSPGRWELLALKKMKMTNDIEGMSTHEE